MAQGGVTTAGAATSRPPQRKAKRERQTQEEMIRRQREEGGITPLMSVQRTSRARGLTKRSQQTGMMIAHFPATSQQQSSAAVLTVALTWWPGPAADISHSGVLPCYSWLVPASIAWCPLSLHAGGEAQGAESLHHQQHQHG